MENTAMILEDINVLIIRLLKDYPEIYQFLEEEPFIISASGKNPINAEALEQYRESLRDLIDHYEKSKKLLFQGKSGYAGATTDNLFYRRQVL